MKLNLKTEREQGYLLTQNCNSMSKKILVVEDNIITAKYIANTLKKADYEVTGTVDNAEDVLKSISENKPDLAILDINLGTEIDGITIAHTIRKEHQVPFIFLTSYNDEATINRIIEAQPLGYIVKPMNPYDFNRVVELALFKIKNEGRSTLPESEQNASDTAQLKDFIFIKNSKNIERVSIPSIDYVEADGRYTYLHYNGQKKISNASLKVLTEKLRGHAFIQIHRSFIVNLNKIETISQSTIRVNNTEIPVGRTYRNDLLDLLDVI